MVVVLKAVRGFPKNCWDSNINLNVIKGMVRLKKKKKSAAMRISVLDVPCVHPSLSFILFHCGILFA